MSIDCTESLISDQELMRRVQASHLTENAFTPIVNGRFDAARLHFDAEVRME